MIHSATQASSALSPRRTLLVAGAGAALALAAMVFSGGAHARSDVSFSVGVAVPGVVIGATNAYPVYTQPVYQPVYNQPVYTSPTYGTYGYPQPVYVQPRPVYVQPQPVYVQRPPVYFAPAPIYYRGGRHWDHGRHHGHGGRHDGHRR